MDWSPGLQSRFIISTERWIHSPLGKKKKGMCRNQLLLMELVTEWL